MNFRKICFPFINERVAKGSICATKAGNGKSIFDSKELSSVEIYDGAYAVLDCDKFWGIVVLFWFNSNNVG